MSEIVEDTAPGRMPRSGSECSLSSAGAGGARQAQRGAAFGLCKALGLEWHHVFCRGIDLAESLAAPAAAAAVVREITCADLTLREVG